MVDCNGQVYGPITFVRQWAAFFFQAEDGIRGHCVTGVQTCVFRSPLAFVYYRQTSSSPVSSLSIVLLVSEHLTVTLVVLRTPPFL